MGRESKKEWLYVQQTHFAVHGEQHNLVNKLCVCVQSLGCGQLFVTLWTVAHQARLSMEFSRHEYCSGLPFPSPGDLPNRGIEPRSPALQEDSLLSETQGKAPGKVAKVST